MNDYVLSCCSTADLSKKHFEEIDVKYICFHYELDGKQYNDDLGESMPLDVFYQKMKDGAMTKTSQVTVGEYLAYFEEILSSGKDLIHLCLSSGISGSYNSAMIAMNELKDKYKDRKIYVIDSLAASSGYGLLIDKLASLKKEGLDIDALAKYAEEHKLELNHWFFTTDLTYLVRGGRVSKVAGLIGSMFSICPLLNVSNEGKLIARAKVRGEKKVILAMVEKMKTLAKDRLAYNDKCYICHSACLDTAKTVAKLVEETFPNLNGKVEINDIGTTIGSHTGPGTVALFFWGDKRVD